jgi:hypothetical protein
VVVGPKARKLLARALKRHRHPTVRVNVRAIDGAGNRSALAAKSLRVAASGRLGRPRADRLTR